jgi:methylaspartate mutase epsilon subunit
VKATEVGVLDQVFATNQHVAGKVIGVRDLKGAVRYLDHGNLPFGTEILEFHREKISERESNRGGVVDYDTVVQDLFAISTGTLVQH